MFLSSN